MSTTWKDPRTAKPEDSIWLPIPEDEFRTHLVDLSSRTNSIPIDPQVFPVPTSPPNRNSSTRSPRQTLSQPPVYTLSLEVEQQTADDLSFLASATEGAQSVTALCIEEHCSFPDQTQPTLILRFATLDSLLSSTIKNSLSSITDFVSSIATASKRQSVKVLRKLLLDKILDLHHQRILARLRSSKWRKPTYLSRSHKKALWKDFANLLHRIQFLYMKGKVEKEARREVEALVKGLEAVYSDFEMNQEDERNGLQNLVDASFQFCAERLIKDFLSRLTSATTTSSKKKPPTPQQLSALKTLRQIQKIASYRRIANSLVVTVLKYSSLFREIKIEYLPPYKPVETNIAYEEWARLCHVHAEVNLVTHYNLSQTQAQGTLRPRCIGTSKHLCYLCYLFLLAYNVVFTSSVTDEDDQEKKWFISKTHGRLYDQWTIPDLAEYSKHESGNLVGRYRDMIAMMDRWILERWSDAIKSGSGSLPKPISRDEFQGLENLKIAGVGEERDAGSKTRDEGKGEFWRLMPMTSVEVLECYADEEGQEIAAT